MPRTSIHDTGAVKRVPSGSRPGLPFRAVSRGIRRQRRLFIGSDGRAGRTAFGVVGVLGVCALAACAGATDATVVADSTTTTIAPTTTLAPLPACVSRLSVEQKAGQLIMVLVPSPAAAGDLVASGRVAGYALVGDQDPNVGAEVAAVAARSTLPVLASGDEEGGTVQRFRTVLGPIPSAAKLAASGPKAAAATFGEYASKLRGLGLNMNFGPSLDVGTGSGLGTRSFGDTVDGVSTMGDAVIAAVRAAGLIPVAKHWPGIGGGTADPHKSASPVAPIDNLRARDLVPFERAFAAGLDAVMVSHAIIPGLTDGAPASLSPAAITGELRGRERYDGLVVTDSLGMGAVASLHDPTAATVLAISAGADLALVSTAAAVPAAHSGLVGAINGGQIPAAQIDRSVGRVLRAKGITGGCAP